MNTESTEHTPADQSWFEKKSSIRIMIVGLIIVCIGLFLAEFTYTNDHTHFELEKFKGCLLYTSPSPRDQRGSRMPSSA